tara:strand:+ start:577 stop:1131 length:555 start_codon:yes stop_codon:yes gene_type:complete
MEYTITKIDSGVATVTYNDGSYAHLLMSDDMSEAEFDALAFDYAPKTGSVPFFASEGAKRNAKERNEEHYNGVFKSNNEWTQEKVDRLTSYEIVQLAIKERNLRLSQSDWVALKALESGTSVSSRWKDYRQELRDLPDAGILKWNPSIALIDVEGEEVGDGRFYISKDIKVYGVEWPTKPKEVR